MSTSCGSTLDSQGSDRGPTPGGGLQHGVSAGLEYWTKANPRMALKVLRLVSAVLWDPFDGLGRPEPLRHSLARMWSRRIDKENRLVYQVEDARVRFFATRYHY